jgi:hypothetical protein
MNVAVDAHTSALHPALGQMRREIVEDRVRAALFWQY